MPVRGQDHGRVAVPVPAAFVRRLPEQIDFRSREIFRRPAIAVAGFAWNCPENGYWRTAREPFEPVFSLRVKP
ncbi:MAG: hypothetical protein ACLQIQ_21655 [Beijerinckiaceae bacterium]